MSDLAKKYLAMTDVERCYFIGRMCEEKHRQMARPEQIPGAGHEDTWITALFQGGRGSGKTFSAAGDIRPKVLQKPGFQVGILAPTFDHAIKVCLFGESGIVPRIPDESLWTWKEKSKQLIFANGSVITVFSSEHIRQLRGPQFHYLWIDEPADISHGMACWEIARPSVRLPQKDGTPARIFVTGTPRPVPLIIHLNELHEKSPERYTFSIGSSNRNKDNLDPAMLEELNERYKGSRYHLQEVEGQLLTQAEGALWAQETIAVCQADFFAEEMDFDEIVIGVDPALSEEKKADETGIIVGGAVDDTAYIISDYSMKSSTLEWGRKLVEISDRHNVRTWVLEDNLAGPLVKDVLQKALDEVDSKIRIKRVHARGKKAARAEPVAAMYEAGKVKHLKQDTRTPDLKILESQMTTWDPQDSKSPDRIDALVHVVTYLLLRNKSGKLHIPTSSYGTGGSGRRFMY